VSAVPGAAALAEQAQNNITAALIVHARGAAAGRRQRHFFRVLFMWVVSHAHPEGFSGDMPETMIGACYAGGRQPHSKYE